jgi:hypothetical protein
VCSACTPTPAPASGFTEAPLSSLPADFAGSKRRLAIQNRKDVAQMFAKAMEELAKAMAANFRIPFLKMIVMMKSTYFTCTYKMGVCVGEKLFWINFAQARRHDHPRAMCHGLWKMRVLVAITF